MAGALNGDPKISDKTRSRVLAAAAELGYDPNANQGARALISRRYGKRPRSGTVALLIPPYTEEGARLRDNPFYVPVFAGAEIEVNARGLDVLTCSTRDGDLPRLIRGGNVDGVICIGTSNQIPALQALDIPVVSLEATSADVPQLLPQDQEGICLAAQHLIDLGHRRIAYLGMTPDFVPAIQRLDGYLDALREAGMEPVGELIEATGYLMSRQAGSELLLQLHQRTTDYTALVCYNDMLAIGAVRALEELGRAVPEDISVVGFDDLSPQMEFRPELTSVAFDRFGMGRVAVQLLLEAIEGAPQAGRQYFPVQLMVRDSTRALPPAAKRG